MKLDRILGTDLEIHAAASLWQVPIYLCTQNPKYFWIHFKPTERAKLVCPVTKILVRGKNRSGHFQSTKFTPPGPFLASKIGPI